MRFVAFICIAVALLLMNIWFVQWARTLFFSREFIIAPFEVQSAGGEGRASANLARLLNARLGALQQELSEVRGSAQHMPHESAASPARDQNLATTTLFIPQEVVIPTGLLQPININVAVGGVEVGGIISWLQRMLTATRTLTFTVIERGDIAIVSADLRGFNTTGNLIYGSSPPKARMKLPPMSRTR